MCKHKHRRIDLKVEQAIEYLRSASKLFMEAAKAAFGPDVDVKIVREAFRRYLEHNSLAQWVRRFVYRGDYRKLVVT